MLKLLNRPSSIFRYFQNSSMTGWHSQQPFSISLYHNNHSSESNSTIHFRKGIKIGEKASMKRRFSAQDVSDFAKLSGDFNPLHFDSDFAKQHGLFKDRIVHGVLVSSLLSNLAGTVMPGAGSIYMSQELKFLRPVYIDQEIEASVVLKEAQSTRKSGDKKVIFVIETEVRSVENGDLLVCGVSRLYHANLEVIEQ
ncbi:hypothetical protein C9374_011294 [Naegleria lovaniensis]|uniref:MaoC-like domain-containing protein n=1 Tax=Naegleria lovaniensis TaxID=51637 RepID=A0AA88H2Q2_NAELO|nr:uncharacterized protein C9374_011294 [Naegleria lovaniensis]KAG2392569.1 hypothetical protein C9374_011294 [Naegleria lovaniensis]